MCLYLSVPPMLENMVKQAHISLIWCKSFAETLSF